MRCGGWAPADPPWPSPSSGCPTGPQLAGGRWLVVGRWLGSRCRGGAGKRCRGMGMGGHERGAGGVRGPVDSTWVRTMRACPCVFSARPQPTCDPGPSRGRRSGGAASGPCSRPAGCSRGHCARDRAGQWRPKLERGDAPAGHAVRDLRAGPARCASRLTTGVRDRSRRAGAASGSLHPRRRAHSGHSRGKGCAHGLEAGHALDRAPDRRGSRAGACPSRAGPSSWRGGPLDRDWALGQLAGQVPAAVASGCPRYSPPTPFPAASDGESRHAPTTNPFTPPPTPPPFLLRVSSP
jgi:hypothetical protein